MFLLPLVEVLINLFLVGESHLLLFTPAVPRRLLADTPACLSRRIQQT